MKRIKNGFTLVELLAVIVVLGIILVIAGTNVMNIRKKANIEEVKKLEQTLTDLGPNVYSHEYISGDKVNSNYFYQKYEKLQDNVSTNNSFKISLGELASAGYLKSATISNPAGGNPCTGYLQVTKTSEGPEFKGYISCDNLYETSEYSNSSFTSSLLTK